MEKTRKILQGEVVSAGMDKSIVVMVSKRYKHPLYKKFITKRNKLMAHDEKNQAGVGDVVKVIETRPLSKMKRYALLEVVKKADVVE